MARTPPAAPLFTVLLPTHGRDEVIGHAIRSVLDQTVADFELLIAGDGVADRTRDVVASFADPRIRWFDSPKGPGAGYVNRNRALAEARGRLVAFIAHDDIMLPDHLELLAAPFRDERVGWGYSRPLWVDDHGTVVPFYVNLHDPVHRHAFMHERNSLPATCVVYRRDEDDPAPWPEDAERLGDWILWKRLVGGLLERHGARGIAHVRHPTCLHFRADWRRSDRWGPSPLMGMLRAREAAPASWPNALSLFGGSEDEVASEGTVTPQHRVAALMRADPNLSRRLRGGVTLLQDRLVWAMTQADDFALPPASLAPED